MKPPQASTANNHQSEPDIAVDPELETKSKDDGLTTHQEIKKRIPVPEHVEPEPKKRGFLSRFFLPNG